MAMNSMRTNRAVMDIKSHFFIITCMMFIEARTSYFPFFFIDVTVTMHSDAVDF